jgi:hypothetical protein
MKRTVWGMIGEEEEVRCMRDEFPQLRDSRSQSVFQTMSRAMVM